MRELQRALLLLRLRLLVMAVLLVYQQQMTLSLNQVRVQKGPSMAAMIIVVMVKQKFIRTTRSSS